MPIQITIHHRAYHNTITLKNQNVHAQCLIPMIAVELHVDVQRGLARHAEGEGRHLVVVVDLDVRAGRVG